jgi:hypothetical protein
MTQHWNDYVKSCYDLVLESEASTNQMLQHEVEAYVVHLMANNFERTDIGDEAIAIKMLTAMQKGRAQDFLLVGDECLLIHSYPLRRSRWPSPGYYRSMGTIAYGMANHIMEKNFEPAGRVLSAIFCKIK